MQPLDINQYTESLNKQKEILKSKIVNSLEWNTLYRYLLVPLSPYTEFSARVRVDIFQWLDNDQLYIKPHSEYKHFYENSFTASCSIRFDNIERQDEFEYNLVEYIFNLTCKSYFDLGNTARCTIELLDKGRMLISDVNDSIFSFYQQVGIESDEFILEGEELSERFRQFFYKSQPPIQIDPFTTWLEILYCLQRVRFSIGNMFLYRPYLDNPIWHSYYLETKCVYPSGATVYDERYFTFCEFTYQSLYHFWDRIGDSLAAAIPTNIPTTAVDFSRIIDSINNNPTLNTNPHFQWLVSFKTNEYKILNDDRKQTVHYETITSRMNRLHIKHFSNRTEVEQRQKWIESRIDYFVDHFHRCVEGLRQLTLFLESK